MGLREMDVCYHVYYVFLLLTMMVMGDAYFTDTLKKSVQTLKRNVDAGGTAHLSHCLFRFTMSISVM